MQIYLLTSLNIHKPYAMTQGKKNPIAAGNGITFTSSRRGSQGLTVQQTDIRLTHVYRSPCVTFNQ